MENKNDEISDTVETMGFVADEEYKKNPVAFRNAIREAENDGWQRLPDDEAPNKPGNRDKFDIVEIGTILYFKAKEKHGK